MLWNYRKIYGKPVTDFDDPWASPTGEDAVFFALHGRKNDCTQMKILQHFKLVTRWIRRNNERIDEGERNES